MSTRPENDERVLVLAPWGSDASLAIEILGQAGFPALAVPDVGGLCEEARRRAGALVLSEEALDAAALESLGELLTSQEPWSDLPLLLLTAHGRAVTEELEQLLELGNVTLLERPLKIVTLVSAVKAAVRARRRQYGARATLLELQAVLDTVPAAVFIAREGGRQISGNRHAAELDPEAAGAKESFRSPAGRRREAFRLMRDGVELSPEERPIERAIATAREVRDAVLDLVTSGGEVRHLLGSAAPLLDRRGSVAGAVAAYVDITEQHRAAEALRESDRRKSEFLAVLSHELRNPLAAIRNAVHLLSLPQATPGQAARAREVIDRQSGHLSRLVDDLLDVTRIERGKIALRPEGIDLSEIARRTAEDLRPLFEEREMSLEVSTPGPVWIQADPTRIAQVIGNLLQNAARFGRKGGSARLRTGVRAGSAELRVEDDGRGIPPELLDRLFVPFVQDTRGLSRAQGGLGLGLSLVKGLVELHRGTVRAHSEGLGRGAQFLLTLPLADARPADLLSGKSRPAGGRAHLLIIEDNADAARMLADLLETEGYTVDVAVDGATGLARARELAPEVILCDIGLPDMDGYDLARALRREPALSHSRLIALSGYAQSEDRERSEAAGFDAHLAKPADLAELERLIEDGRRSGAGAGG